MTSIKINNKIFPAIIEGKIVDYEWDQRESKTITLEQSYDNIKILFKDDIEWSICEEEERIVQKLDENNNPVYDEIGNPILEIIYIPHEYDNSEYSIAGDIIDHRDGTFSIKMGKPTELEKAYGILYGGI